MLVKEREKLEILLENRNLLLTNLASKFVNDKNVQYIIGRILSHPKGHEEHRSEIPEIAEFLELYMEALYKYYEKYSEGSVKEFFLSPINFSGGYGKVVASKVCLMYPLLFLLSELIEKEDFYIRYSLYAKMQISGDFIKKKIESKLNGIDLGFGPELFLMDSESFHKFFKRFEERYQTEKDGLKRKIESLKRQINDFSENERFEAGIVAFERYAEKKGRAKKKLMEDFKKIFGHLKDENIENERRHAKTTKKGVLLDSLRDVVKKMRERIPEEDRKLLQKRWSDNRFFFCLLLGKILPSFILTAIFGRLATTHIAEESGTEDRLPASTVFEGEKSTV